MVILFGVYIFSAGTFVSVKDIVNYFRNKWKVFIRKFNSKTLLLI
jgi:hypothetical protein